MLTDLKKLAMDTARYHARRATIARETLALCKAAGNRDERSAAHLAVMVGQQRELAAHWFKMARAHSAALGSR